MTQTINARLQKKDTLIGTWISLTDPAVVEAISRTGFDFLLIDGEHAPIGESELGNLLRAAVGSESAIVYRVRENNEALIKMALDMGVDGVFVPQINSADEARRAVNAAKYPPLGGRGVGPHRASDYYQNYVGYVEEANANTTLILQIEHIDAVNALDEILAVDGIDALYIGPADLSMSMGLFGRTSHPDFLAAIDLVITTCAAAGMPLGMDTAGVAHLAEMAGKGMQILTLGMDLLYMIDGATALSAEIRAAL